MKKLISFLVILMPILSNAQISLTRLDFPKPTSSSSLPDSVLFTTVLGASTTSQNNNGANQNWVETGLSGAASYQNYVAMSSTPLVFQLAFLTCDYAQPLLNGGGVAGGTLSDAFEYYNYAASDARLEIKGFGGNITIPPATTGIPLPAVYSSPDVLYTFPITFGNTDSSQSGFSLSVPLPAPLGTVQVKRKQKRVNTVDAWGSITTPAGTFNVLRVVSKINRVDSLITGAFPLGFPSNPIEYKWLGNDKKLPVLQINGNTTGGTFVATNVTFWGQGPAGISNYHSTELNRFVFPNPFIQDCSIAYDLESEANVDVRIFSFLGHLAGEFHFGKQYKGTHHEILPVSHLPAGTYFIQIKAENKESVQKVVKYQ